MRITVFTPAYNRGYIIEKLYRSLQNQTFRNFEWLIIDDGSSDNTSEKIQSFIQDNNDFPIIFEKVENGGKHRAINLGVQKARGELFFIVDSDDYLTNTSLEIVDQVEKAIPKEQKKNFAGICGERGYSENEIMGTTFKGDVIDITSLERIKYGITGDKAEVFYTKVIKQYPFPEFEGEKFLTECIVWDRIAAAGYKLRYFNKIIYICDYLPDGLTMNSEKMFLTSPKGYGLFLYQEKLYHKMTGLKMWNQYLQYYYKLRNKYSFMQIARNVHMNPVILYFRLTGMKLFYKIYDK